MTSATGNAPTVGDGGATAVEAAEPALTSWQDLRADTDIQFAPVVFPERPPREPSWLERLLRWLAEQINLGEAYVGFWSIFLWILIGLAVCAALFLLYRIFGLPMLANRRVQDDAADDGSWQPDQAQSLALLDEADKLAAEGRFDEATHLLLQRSVGQIAEARPDWVEPSSTARELASLAELPAATRDAFALIAERVERSLFALRSLERDDWEIAREAYARFALAPIASVTA